MLPDTKKALLAYSRAVLKERLFGVPASALECNAPEVNENRGAFVTLKQNGVLRGCIGHIYDDRPLAVNVRDMTLEAAFGDPRFPPVRRGEFDSITIEISALTPFTVVGDIEEIEIGKHGLMLSLGYRAGLLLPQVPIEWGWSRDEFLHHLCMKAGLPSGSHLNKKAVLKRFSAEVFSEEDFIITR